MGSFRGIWIARSAVLLVLFYVLFISGSLAVSGKLPDVESEPGLIPTNIGLLIFGITNALLVIGLILSSRWNGWKLALTLAFAYYGAVTFLTQIETWYFLSKITVDEKLLPGLFIMGLPIAFVYVPLAVWILGKGPTRDNTMPTSAPVIPVKQWIWKLMVIAVVYLVLYWSAGYYIAWQNPELRAFYESPGEIVPFWKHLMTTLSEEPGLVPLQVFRAMLWTLCALPVIRGSKINIWWTAVLLGLFLTIPQSLGLIFENPLMPIASVRLSHMIEGIVSNFGFAMFIAWLFHREHKSIQDLFGIEQ